MVFIPGLKTRGFQPTPYNNEVWFLVQDVLRELELSANNASKFLDRHVSADFKQQISLGVGRPSWYLAEPGIYQLAFQSKTEKSLRFQRWVFKDVLPAIRKHGGYISPTATSEQLDALQEQIINLKNFMVRG